MHIFFNKIDGFVLLRQKATGTFRQADLYEHDKHVFAKYTNGYIRILDHHGTSNPNVFWDALVLSEPYHSVMGRLVLGSKDASKKPNKPSKSFKEAA